jgi:glycosyltransferase involved in cell wall biosynthesis
MGQCLRSNGGFFYHGYAEFAEALDLLLERPEVGQVLGAQGKAYVDAEYAWERVEQKVEDLLALIRNIHEGHPASFVTKSSPD